MDNLLDKHIILKEKQEKYLSLLAQVYNDGDVEVFERRELIELRKQLGINDSLAKELEKSFIKANKEKRLSSQKMAQPTQEQNMNSELNKQLSKLASFTLDSKEVIESKYFEKMSYQEYLNFKKLHLLTKEHFDSTYKANNVTPISVYVDKNNEKSPEYFIYQNNEDKTYEIEYENGLHSEIIAKKIINEDIADQIVNNSIEKNTIIEKIKNRESFDIEINNPKLLNGLDFLNKFRFIYVRNPDNDKDKINGYALVADNGVYLKIFNQYYCEDIEKSVLQFIEDNNITLVKDSKLGNE